MDRNPNATKSAPHSSNHGHALVIGGSIAGLLAARVLADHFDRVTIVERDRFPEKAEPRPGVPQSNQVHVLLTRGQQILEQLFPGFKAELADKNSSSVDWTADSPFLSSSGWAPRFPSGITTQTCTRNLLEMLIRKRLTTYPHLQFRDASQVVNLLGNTDNTAIQGVLIRDRDGNQAELSAQLVIDASGRGSKAPEWLQTLGYGKPKETAIDSFLGYASRWYQCPADFQSDWKVLTIMTKAPNKTRAGSLFPIEDNRWIVTLAGVCRDYPPVDEAGFLDFAHSLRSPIIYKAIENAQPLSPVYSYRRTGNRLRHYERMSKFPENFVIIGDAVCAFNPIYGQGMTVAMLGALTLDRCLKQYKPHRNNKDLRGFSRRFQKHLAKVNNTSWQMAIGEDLRWPTTIGAKPNTILRLMHAYIDRVIMVAVENPKVYQTFLEVMHMLKPMSALFKPSILIQVLEGLIKEQSIKYSNSHIDEVQN
jgi:2-polyprenyl-6-methoxyphenol hydroxylase-like FAD-dependent oxidoreductase